MMTLTTCWLVRKNKKTGDSHQEGGGQTIRKLSTISMNDVHKKIKTGLENEFNPNNQGPERDKLFKFVLLKLIEFLIKFTKPL